MKERKIKIVKAGDMPPVQETEQVIKEKPRPVNIEKLRRDMVREVTERKRRERELCPLLESI